MCGSSLRLPITDRNDSHSDRQGLLYAATRRSEAWSFLDAAGSLVSRHSCSSAFFMDSTSPQPNGNFEHHFRDRFESLLPTIQKRWPELAHHTLEATRGSVEELVRLIERNTGLTPQGAREQLEELMHSAGDRSKHLADTLDPLEEQLEQLLDELNSTLRPRIERPVRQRPLLAVGVALGVGVLVGAMLRGGRRS